MRFLMTLSMLLLSLQPLLAQTPATSGVDALERELQAMQNLKAEKLRALEQAEAARWESRYRQEAMSKEYDQKTRALEGKYSRLAADLSRVEEQQLREQARTREALDELETRQSEAERFRLQLRQAIQDEAEAVSRDFPIGLNNRNLAYSRATEMLEGENPDIAGALELFFSTRLDRHLLTLDQELSTRSSLFDGEERPVWQLRLGTVFAGELEKEGGNRTQLLLRTGALQGKTYAWRTDLASNYNQKLAQAIRGAREGGGMVSPPLDVLQSKGFGTGFTSTGETDRWQSFRAWFASGGVVMYPLVLIALFAILLALERLLLYWRRQTNTEALMAKLEPMLEKDDWDGALHVAKKSDTSLGRTVRSILSKAGLSREAGEKAARESMLREIPVLEKRLGLIAALGGAAPLLGLLGTVSGIITLFKVINEVGTNDPKILAGGISEALVTTQTGLIIAIPILLIHGFLRERLDSISSSLLSSSTTVLNRIWPEA